jgi:hypothetical protein
MEISNLVDLFVLLLVLVVAWILLRYILRFTMRIFSCGCALIVVLAVLLLILRQTGILQMP